MRILFSFFCLAFLCVGTSQAQITIGSDGTIDATVYNAAVNPQQEEGLRFILLRGLIREKRHWGSFPEKLQNLFPAAEIVSLDVPGAGEFFQQESPMSISSYVDRLKEDLFKKSQLKGKTKTIMIAISLGAMIATNWAYRFPDADFQKMILINPSFKGFCSIFDRFMIFSNENYMHMWNYLMTKNEQFVANMVVNDSRKHSSLISNWQKIKQEAPVSFGNTLRQLWAAIWYRPSNMAPPVSTILLSGQGDKLVSPSCSEEIHKRWQIPIFYNKTAGHDLPADDANWVLEQIRSFI